MENTNLLFNPSEIFKQIEKCAVENSVPPIKGKITIGKLRWRGLKLVTKMGEDHSSCTYHLEQRGKKISPSYTFSVEVVFK